MNPIRHLALSVGCALSVFSTLSFATNTNNDPCSDQQCVAIVDAGSTGSRIHLYAYDLNAQHMPVHINELFTQKIRPGLASLDAIDENTIDTYLTQLMSGYPVEKVPVYVYATAGMRLKSLDDQQRRYGLIKDWFAKHPEWPLQEARTISGPEEGLFAWLALNQHLNTLDESDKPTAGLIEIGGASAQIAFSVQDTTGLDSDDLRNITINHHNITIFTHSFLGLGANEIFNQSQDRAACFPVGYPLKDGSQASGNAYLCQEQIGTMINQNFRVNDRTHAALSQNPTDNWFTVSAISAMANQAPFDFSTSEFTAQEMLEQADVQLCQQDYQPLLERFPNNEYLLRNCLIASYFYGLLVHGYGFNPKQEIHYFSGLDTDWTLGVLLSQSQVIK